jgi:hypothetical protein
MTRRRPGEPRAGAPVASAIKGRDQAISLARRSTPSSQAFASQPAAAPASEPSARMWTKAGSLARPTAVRKAPSGSRSPMFSMVIRQD